MKSINAPVYSITGQLLLPEEEVLPPTIWQEFQIQLMTMAEAQMPLDDVFEELQKTYKIEKI